MTLALQSQPLDTVTWAKQMAPATILPAQYRNAPGNLFFAAEYADSLGISRVHALTSIHVIEGKPSASAELMAARVRQAGHKLRIVGDDTFAEAILVRKDDPEFEFKVRWTMDRAAAAKLLMKGGKVGNWEKYPAAMLRARAVSEIVRMAASEVMAGVIYTPEELGSVVDQDGNPLASFAMAAAQAHVVQAHAERTDEQQAPQQQQQQAPQARNVGQGGTAGLLDAVQQNATVFVDVDALKNQIADTTNIEALKELWESNKDRAGGRREELLNAVTDMLEVLRAPKAEPEQAPAEAQPEPEQATGEQLPIQDAEVVPDPQDMPAAA